MCSFLRVHPEPKGLAYPKRILAWHERARDAVGGVELTIVILHAFASLLVKQPLPSGAAWPRSYGTEGIVDSILLLAGSPMCCARANLHAKIVDYIVLASDGLLESS
jgi:hypothetical protein